jgi:endonuclease YncB( thermonuclease family)
LHESRVGSLIGKVKVQAWTTRSKKCKYRISLISPPRLAALALSPSRAIDAAKDGLIKDTNAQQVSFDERNLGDKPGRLLVYTLPDGKFGRAWFVVLGKKCVVLDINGARRDVDHESPHFFTSLHAN